MKKIISSGSIALLVLLLITSCKKDVRVLETDITPVSNLISPADQTDIALQPVTGASIVFKWNPAKTADSGLVLYQIAFDKPDGDFSKPVYKSVSDGSGVQPQATITQKDLNKIAALGGIMSSSTGKVKWAVYASKVTNTKISSQVFSLTIDRPAGFAIIPDSMFITGSATEGGTDISKAIPLKKTEDGVFELYTSLKAGSYLLSDKTSAGGTQYFVDANNRIQIGNTPVVITDTAKPYRLNFDFNVATSKITAINSLGLYMSAYDQEIGQLSYIGNSTWEAASIPIVFYQFSWGRDERHKFILHTADGLEYWGSQNANNNPPAGQPASYFYLIPVTNAQWDNTYKFDPSADNHNVKVDVYFKATGPYFYNVTTL